MTAALQAHFDRLKALKATPGDVVEIRGGVEWARTHPMICPWCRDPFFTWKPVDAPWVPYRIDPEPELGKRPRIATRETCGHPLCRKQESEHQLKRRLFHAPPAVLLQKA